MLPETAIPGHPTSSDGEAAEQYPKASLPDREAAAPDPQPSPPDREPAAPDPQPSAPGPPEPTEAAKDQDDVGDFINRHVFEKDSVFFEG